MPKILCIFGLVVSGLFLLIFGLDLGVGVPFNGANRWVMDLPMTVCALALGYISWTTFREQV